MAEGLQIGKAAQQTGLSVDTIRFYEKEGPINASKDQVLVVLLLSPT